MADRADQDQPARALVPRGPGALPASAQPAPASAPGAGLPLDRLRALHPRGSTRRAAACRPLARVGQIRVRHPPEAAARHKVVATAVVAAASDRRGWKQGRRRSSGIPSAPRPGPRGPAAPRFRGNDTAGWNRLRRKRCRLRATARPDALPAPALRCPGSSGRTATKEKVIGIAGTRAEARYHRLSARGAGRRAGTTVAIVQRRKEKT